MWTGDPPRALYLALTLLLATLLPCGALAHQSSSAWSAPSSWTERTLASLTVREKAGQLIMPWLMGDFVAEGDEGDLETLEWVEELGVGGLVMSIGSPTEVAAKLNHLQSRSRLPLLVAADLETGAGYRLRGAMYMPGATELGGATAFPSLMAVGAAGDTSLAYEMGRITAVEARAVGIHVPFAPVLDVNVNPENPIINVRSFGAEPGRVAELGTAFVLGVQEHGALAVGKHFPGHGDTDVDSHLELPMIHHDRARLDSVELRPFRAALGAGMAGVMTAHISLPSVTGSLAPSTLSRPVLTGLLREEMGFRGLVFTDAMEMRAITRGWRGAEATLQALEAGADVILMPPSPADAIDAVANAVESGRITEARLDESVRRILRAKEALGLDVARVVPINGVRKSVGVPAHAEAAAEVARRSITVLKNGRNLLPLVGTRRARVMSVTYRMESDLLSGRYFNRRLRETYSRLVAESVHSGTPADVYESLVRRARGQALVVVSLYVSAIASENDAALPEEATEFIDWLAGSGVPHVVVSFGNPYLISEFPDVRASILAWSRSEASQTAAAGALFGDFAVSGRTPTPIPPLYEVGDGITLPAKSSR